MGNFTVNISTALKCCVVLILRFETFFPQGIFKPRILIYRSEDYRFNIQNILFSVTMQLFSDPCCALKYYPEIEACVKVKQGFQFGPMEK